MLLLDSLREKGDQRFSASEVIKPGLIVAIILPQIFGDQRFSASEVIKLTQNDSITLCENSDQRFSASEVIKRTIVTSPI